MRQAKQGSMQDKPFLNKSSTILDAFGVKQQWVMYVGPGILQFLLPNVATLI